MPTCPSSNTEAIDQSSFWAPGQRWDAHRKGWAISGACAVATVLISLVSVLRHCLNYTNRREQKQILRVLYMPPIYAVISFFSYRYFRKYTYFSLVEVSYEAVTLSAFLLLIVEYVASTAAGHKAELAISRKDKRSLPIFCCWRYRPTKAYFMHAVKWSVLQYVIFRPLITIIAIICEANNVLCESKSFDAHFANVYLEAFDFITISIALYGLVLFYTLVKDELAGRKPLAKFLAIKLIVIFTFYQSFVFSALEGRVIHATQFWTETNIADGLNALAICIEMVFFSIFMLWAYPSSEYKRKDGSHTNIFRPLWDSINYSDFAREIFVSLRYFFNALFRRRQPAYTSEFDLAFGLNRAHSRVPSGPEPKSRITTDIERQF